MKFIYNYVSYKVVTCVSIQLVKVDYSHDVQLEVYFLQESSVIVSGLFRSDIYWLQYLVCVPGTATLCYEYNRVQVINVC